MENCPKHEVLKVPPTYLADTSSAARCDSAAGPGRRWSADAVRPGRAAEVHSPSGSPPALDRPTGDTGDRHQGY